MSTLVFKIIDGKPLDLIKAFSKQRKEVMTANNAMANKYKASAIKINQYTSQIQGLKFSGQIHEDFVGPDEKGFWAPKPNSRAWFEFQSSPAHRSAQDIVVEEFGAVLSFTYHDRDRRLCTRYPGMFENQAGLVYLSLDGPYFLYMPDLNEALTEELARGNKPTIAPIHYKIDGCVSMTKEEYMAEQAAFTAEQRAKQNAQAA